MEEPQEKHMKGNNTHYGRKNYYYKTWSCPPLLPQHTNKQTQTKAKLSPCFIFKCNSYTCGKSISNLQYHHLCKKKKAL